MAMRVHYSALAIVVGLFACGPSDGDGKHDDATATLSVSPANVEMTIENGVPPSAEFTATLTYPDGDTRDVTNEVHWSVDSGYGMFTANAVTMYSAGKTQIHALLTDKSGASEVIVRLHSVRVDPSLPPNAADLFNGPDDPARAPMVVYPPADVVMPRNLGDFEVHWTDAQNDMFELSLKTEFTDVRAIVPGGNGVIANSTWSAFLAQEWLSAVSYEPTVQFEVRGVNKANPTSVGSSGPRLVRLTNEQMLGGLYYWAATAQNGPFGIFRHDMSKPGQPAEEYMTTTQTGGRCVACHVLSRDGTKMSVTFDGGNGAATLLDVGTKAMQPSQRGWNFGTFTPDGSQFLAVQNGQLAILDYATQNQLGVMPAAGQVSHPDLSADGTKLVYVSKPSTDLDWSFNGGKIMIRSYDQATKTFGPEQQLVMDTSNCFYPSFSPDGKWVLFNRASNGASYNNGAATLWVTKSDGSGPAVELATAAGTAGLTNSWGRWAPFQQTVGANNESLYWITVSSTRDFGVRLVGANRPQLWMTPFMPDKAEQNADPSASAFRLPFQNIESNNHIAQWTEQIIAVQ
jgi:hypothetical protein